MAEVYLGVGIDASGAQQGAAQFSNATDKVVDSAKSADKATEKFNQQLKQAQLYFKLAATAAAYFVTREISAYTKALSDAQAVTNATASEMARLTKVTRELGASTSFSAAQAAEGAKFLGQAGFTVNEIVAALPATMDLAAAATLEMGQASEITANIMSGFGLAATEVGQAADVLAAISSNANTDVTGMGGAMKYVGPISRSLGISMEDTAAAVGVLANAGIQGTMAGTGLRSSLSSLLTPTAAAKKAIKELGIDIKDLNPNANSLQDIVKRLADAGLDAERAFTIFGERGATSMVALTSNVPMLERLTEVTNNAQGAARRMAEIKLDNIAGDFEKLSGEIAETAQKLGDAGLTGALRKYLQVATTWVESLNKSIEGITSNREQMQLLADAVNVLKNAMITLMALKLVEWLFAAGNAMRLLNIAMAANPWIVAGTALGALVLHLKDLHDETRKWTDYTNKQIDTMDKMGDSGVINANKLRIAFLNARKEILMTELSSAEAAEAKRQAAYDKAYNPFGAKQKPLGSDDPGTFNAIVAAQNARDLGLMAPMRKELNKIDEEIQKLQGKITEDTNRISNTTYQMGRKAARSLIDGIQSINKSDVVKFLSAYIPGISPDESRPTGGGGSAEKKKESFIVGELANLKLQLELTKNLGASESDLYRIRLNDEALREAKEAGLKRITDTMKNQINTAVALFAEENKLKESYEIQKKMTDALKEKLKTSEAAVTVAQNLGASESELLRINLEAQATEAARKAGLQGISAEWQTMIDKIVALAAIQKETKDDFEKQERLKKYTESLQKAYDAEKYRNQLVKEYGSNIAEIEIKMQTYNAAKEQGILLDSKEALAMEEKIRGTHELKKATDAATEAKKKQEQAEKEWANSMTYAFKDAIMNSKNLGDALSNLANRVQDMLVNKALDSLLGGFFGGFSKGAAFQAGGVTAFASGGVVSQPSFFPMSGNRTGLMGEAGPEAIMPLTRTSSGDLGVRAIGGSGTTVIAPVVNITVSGGSEEQNNDAATKVSAAVRDAIDDVVMNVLLREKRPGGSLT